MDSRRNEVARVLFQLAWADGEVQQSEVQAIAHLLEGIGIPLAERLAVIDEGLSQPVAPGALCDQTLDDREVRRYVLAMLIKLVFADEKTHPEELRMLAQVAMRWGFSAEELEALRVHGL